MRTRRLAPVFFFVSAIAFFLAGGLGLRTGSSTGGVFTVLGGAMMVIGASVARRNRIAKAGSEG
jgi:LPXTG-motif cell wall-anchored protein